MPTRAGRPRSRTVTPADDGPSDWWLYGGGAALGLTATAAAIAIAKHAQKQQQQAPRDLDPLPTMDFPPGGGARRSQNTASNARAGGSNGGRARSNASGGSNASEGSMFKKGSRTPMQRAFGARKSRRVKQLREMQGVAQRARRWVNRDMGAGGDRARGWTSQFPGEGARPLVDRIAAYTDPDQVATTNEGVDKTPAMNRASLMGWLKAVRDTHRGYGISFDNTNPGSDWRELQNQLKIVSSGGRGYLR